MAIKRLRVSNFKSFKSLAIELRNFNLLIGANASGKSNFIQIFKFLRDITEFGLDNAISLQGGVEYFRNVNIDSTQDFSIEIVSDQRIAFAKEVDNKLIAIRPYETTYNLNIRFKKTGVGFEIINEKVSHKVEYSILERQKKKIKEKEKLGSGETTISNIGGRIDSRFQFPLKGEELKEEDFLPSFLREEKPSAKVTLLERLAFLPPFMLETIFTDFSIYDFDPRLPKKAVTVTGKAELEEDGSNLAIVLKNIKQSAAKKRKFYNLMREILPFVEEFSVDKFADTLLFKVREIYSKKSFLPASLMSDGTINLTALIISLYFEDKPLKIIEESERNIHPYLISKLVNMMQEASKKSQLICTTHNPEMLKHVDLNDILLIFRDKDGFSCISRPAEKKEIKLFLENEMGIEELYVRNLLEI